MTDSHMTLFQHHPNTNKSTIRKWFDKLTHIGSAHDTVKAHAREAGMTVRQFGEGALTGAALGAVNAELVGGLDPHGVPVDLAVAALAGAGALASSGEDYAHDLRNIGTAAITVFSFRKTDGFLSEKKAAKIAGESNYAYGRENSGYAYSGEGQNPNLDVGAEDPIIRKAREF